MRLADVMQSIPALLLALALIGVLGKGLGNAMVAVGVIFAVSFLRITRAVVLAEREQLYVDAARVLGLRTPSILLGQILPNIAPPLIVQASISLGTALLIEAMLSFLGVGAESTEVSWGAMLETARKLLAAYRRSPMMPSFIAWSYIRSMARSICSMLCVAIRENRMSDSSLGTAGDTTGLMNTPESKQAVE